MKAMKEVIDALFCDWGEGGEMALKCVALVECFQIASTLLSTNTTTVHGEIHTLQTTKFLFCVVASWF